MVKQTVKIVEARDDRTIDAIKFDTSAFDNYIKDLKLKIKQGTVRFYGAHNGTNFVGRVCLALVPEERVVRDLLPGQPALVALQINQSARREGVGSALVTAVIKTARELGHHQLSLGVEEDNAVARALYEKLGFYYSGKSYQSCWNEPNEAGDLKRVCVEAMLMVRQL